MRAVRPPFSDCRWCGNAFLGCGGPAAPACGGHALEHRALNEQAGTPSDGEQPVGSSGNSARHWPRPLVPRAQRRKRGRLRGISAPLRGRGWRRLEQWRDLERAGMAQNSETTLKGHDRPATGTSDRPLSSHEQTPIQLRRSSSIGLGPAQAGWHASGPRPGAGFWSRARGPSGCGFFLRPDWPLPPAAGFDTGTMAISRTAWWERSARITAGLAFPGYSLSSVSGTGIEAALGAAADSAQPGSALWWPLVGRRPACCSQRQRLLPALKP